ncbi:MAG: HemK2/MTQ2 family protein methyltransferase [Candidatus Nanoarchaeia archaeon]
MVYEVAEDSLLLAKAVRKYAKGSVLDMGTGSGVQAITASKKKAVSKVLAVDVDPEAVKYVKKQSAKKVTVKKSDLFSNVKGKFDTIVFNPPYLPQDNGVEDIALYGGKGGYELTLRFLEDVGEHLETNGVLLLLFSSLTRKEVIDDALWKGLFDYETVGQSVHFMEKLYVYKVTKNKVRKTLEGKGAKKLSYFDKGKRGLIYSGKYRGKKIAMKIKNPSSAALGRIANEARWLKKLNKEGIGPKLLFSGPHYIAYKFVEGKFILDWLDTATKKAAYGVLKKCLKQCYRMDELGVSKEEMHRPVKHILVKGSNVVMLDFERTHYTKKTHNVTQFVTFITNRIVQSRIKLPVKHLLKLAGNYRKDPKVFKKILAIFAAS